MSLFVALVALSQSAGWAPIPVAEQPAFVTSATAAVATGQPDALQRGFTQISIVDDSGTHGIAATAALSMLSGCQQGDVHLLHGNTYTVDFACTARRASASGCDSGDLFAIVTGGEREKSFVIANRRKITPDCAPMVPPPPPPPVDAALADKFAQALVSDNQTVLREMVGDGTFVTTVQRFPGSKDITRIGDGKGLAALREQYAGLIQKLGQPHQVQCEDKQAFAFCKFQFRESGRVLLGFLNTKGSGMYLIRFDYAVR